MKSSVVAIEKSIGYQYDLVILVALLCQLRYTVGRNSSTPYSTPRRSSPTPTRASSCIRAIRGASPRLNYACYDGRVEQLVAEPRRRRSSCDSVSTHTGDARPLRCV
jgi:hypothetical protein